MTNILAIAQKELKAYFASPIAYIVIGFWALLYGYFFVAILSFFVRQSMQMNQFGMQGPQSMNVNQQLIRPLLQNVNILVLFLMPMVTMRTYAEEKRSGTIELGTRSGACVTGTISEMHASEYFPGSTCTWRPRAGSARPCRPSPAASPATTHRTRSRRSSRGSAAPGPKTSRPLPVSALHPGWLEKGCRKCRRALPA